MDDNGSKKGLEKKKRTAHHRLRFWLSITTGVLVVVGITILTLLPYAMEWGAENMLLRYGAKTATITDIDFSPMTGHLTVFDLQVEGPNADRAALDRFTIKIDLLPVLRKRIRFREISITGLSLDIRQVENGIMSIGGFPIPEGQTAEQPGPGVENDERPWGLGLRDLDVKELTVHFITPDLDETVVLNRLSLTDFETWAPEKFGDYVLRADLFGGSIDVEGTAQPFTEPMAISTRILLRELSLERFIPYLKDTPVESMSGSLSGRGSVNTTLSRESTLGIASTVRIDIYSRDMSVKSASEGLELELQPGALNIGVSVNSLIDMGDSPSKEAEFAVAATLEGTTSSVESNKTALELRQDALSLEVSGSYSGTGSIDPSRLTASAGLSLKGLILKDGNSPAQLFRLESLDLKGVKIKGPDDIGISQARAGNITLLSRLPDSVIKGEPAQAVALNKLEVTGIRLSDRAHLTVEAVQMDSLDGWFLREKGGDLEALSIVQSLMKKQTAVAGGDLKVEGSKSGNNLTAELERFSLTGNNKLTFRDLAVDPPFNFVVDSLDARILELSTGKMDTSTNVTLNAGMGKYSAVNITANVKPPWDTPDLDMHVGLKGIDLPPLTPYTTSYLGYILQSGHLDTEVDILVEKGILDGQADITINRIEMDAVKEEDEQRAEERLGIPVKTALSLLTDKNDDINLTLPIEGDIKDPEFDISDVVVTATGLALQKGVTAYYKDLGATLLTGGLIPPGTFSLFGKLFSGATTMSFEPVRFDPLDQELNDTSMAYLDLMSEKLEKKPKVRLVLCGKVTREDIVALRQADFDAALAAADTQAAVGTAGAPNPAIEPVSAEPGIGTMVTVEQTVNTGPPTIEEVPLSEDEKERLIELAKQRALAVKDRLTEVGGLGPERVFVCYSDVETEEKELPPRVDLSI